VYANTTTTYVLFKSSLEGLFYQYRDLFQFCKQTYLVKIDFSADFPKFQCTFISSDKYGHLGKDLVKIIFDKDSKFTGAG
jgi:hypothetical protein